MMLMLVAEVITPFREAADQAQQAVRADDNDPTLAEV